MVRPAIEVWEEDLETTSGRGESRRHFLPRWLVPVSERRYPRTRRAAPELKPMASIGAAEKAILTKWKRKPEILGLMRRAVQVGRAAFNYKLRRKEMADHEKLLASVEKLKKDFPKSWSLVIKEEPDPVWWTANTGLGMLLRELKTSEKRRGILIDALETLLFSDLRKRTEAQLITVAVMCTLGAAGKRAPSGPELALLAIVTGFEEPTSDPHQYRQRPDTWANCIETCGRWVDWLMTPTEYEVRVFPDDFPEHQLGSDEPGEPLK